jgi:hypothetical protein
MCPQPSHPLCVGHPWQLTTGWTHKAAESSGTPSSAKVPAPVRNPNKTCTYGHRAGFMQVQVWVGSPTPTG